MSIQMATAAPVARFGSLPAIHVLLLASYGVVLWWLAAWFIRSLTPAGVFHGPAGLVTWVATVGVAYGLAWAGGRLKRLGPERVLPGIVVPCIAALLCDSIAVVWMPGLYGPDAAAMLPGLAWLFFGVSACLLFAYMLDRR
jgi:hypothetical protein